MHTSPLENVLVVQHGYPTGVGSQRLHPEPTEHITPQTSYVEVPTGGASARREHRRLAGYTRMQEPGDDGLMR